MSHTHTTSTSSNLQPNFDNALNAYKKRTKLKKDLLKHPLVDRIRACNSASSILTVLKEQVQDLGHLNESQRNNGKWLDPTVNVLYAFSEALGGGVGLVFPPAKVIFIGFGVLLSTAKDVRADQDALFKMFESIEAFFRRLDIYTKVAPNQGMKVTITAIMVEVLNILAIATKEINRGSMKKCLMKLINKLIGKNDIKDALDRLDRLTQDEEKMASAQLLEIVNRQDLHRWLSPPDPSENHSIAWAKHHEGTSAWFLEGETYNKWKSPGSESLLWIHGKLGSGKSILCSAIIRDIQAMCNAGHASMAYFYFDFRHINKQHRRDLVRSLLIQLSAQSGPRSGILSSLHSHHGYGARGPVDDDQTKCLKDMLTLPDERPTYLIFDALDECSNVSGTPIPREGVLQLVKELVVDPHIPDLHICVTSHRDDDIRHVLEPLTSFRVSLHDERGQKEDIEDYIKSVVYSTSERFMQTWRKEDKELVTKTLTERADGVFRWTSCQLDVLRLCLSPNVRRTLDELPESLDETYVHLLKEITMLDLDRVRRILQCLVVATRPLRVAELKEVLAVDLDDAEGIPRPSPDWRPEDQEQLLIACSNLIVIAEPDDSDSEAETDGGDSHVEAGDSRIAQFSHFSVKAFLTSPRLATASGEVSNYHIDPEPAHTILAQFCLGVLLQIQDGVDRHTPEDHPLARYAAEHWTTHAQFGKVSPRLRKVMVDLFDANKPHFKVWLTLYDIDTMPKHGATFYRFAPNPKSTSAPLYYAALCGFHDLVQHLITKHPQDVNADGGLYVRPLLAALAGKHFETADLLRHNGANLDFRGDDGRNPLHAAAYSGNFEVVRLLIEYNRAYANARDEDGETLLHLASNGHNFKDGSVVRLLLEHGADINARGQDGWTPLHVASYVGALEVVRLLLESSADVQVKNDVGRTALQCAAEKGHDEVVKLLRKHRAK